eukprot:CAMPEP_0194315820 /NCGR_PEP_ID=MMETSP0171-20130528/12602_1 /TAXON_ID=218684 /ORGANISM="Corethron pennatum, Strain L29A3" /LENGTH=238 /DNA_ID=CAMNT_0039071793 /DNA_START=64 /DNA_END=779 /DNA_ORIENTATION=-
MAERAMYTRPPELNSCEDLKRMSDTEHIAERASNDTPEVNSCEDLKMKIRALSKLNAELLEGLESRKSEEVVLRYNYKINLNFAGGADCCSATAVPPIEIERKTKKVTVQRRIDGWTYAGEPPGTAPGLRPPRTLRLRPLPPPIRRPPPAERDPPGPVRAVRPDSGGQRRGPGHPPEPPEQLRKNPGRHRTGGRADDERRQRPRSQRRVSTQPGGGRGGRERTAQREQLQSDGTQRRG